MIIKNIAKSDDQQKRKKNLFVTTGRKNWVSNKKKQTVVTRSDSLFLYNVAVVQSKRATLGCCMYTTTSNGRKRALSQNCKCRHRRLLHHCRLTKRKWKFGKNAKRKDEKKKREVPLLKTVTRTQVKEKREKEDNNLKKKTWLGFLK